MRNIAIIPARSGSKGLPDKNIKELLGKPLMYYTIQAACLSNCFETVMVSTDSEEYANIAKECGAEVPFLRSGDLAADTSGSWDVVREVLARYHEMGKEFDYVALLQPTSPLRDADDIKNAFELLKVETVNCVLSVSKVEHPIQWCFRMEEDGGIKDLADSPYKYMRRQELDAFYRENGAIYIVDANKITDAEYDFYADGCYGYEMPNIKSTDIDTELDFKYAKFLLEES